MKIIFIHLFTYFLIPFAVCQDTLLIHYDNNWKKINMLKSFEYYGKFYKKNDTCWILNKYYLNNKLAMKGEFLNKRLTKKNGKFLYFNKNGKKIAENEYINNNKTGYWINYYDNGKILSEGEYKNNKMNGVWSWYFENGKLESRNTYVNDMLSGASIFYYDNGNIKSAGNYSHDIKKGIWKYYFKNGNIDIEEELNKNLLDGYKCMYFESGGLCCQYLYKNGNKINSKYWNKNAQQIQKSEAIVLKEFPGGSKAMMKFVRRNTIYSLEARYFNIRGTVLIKYKVDDNGNIWDATVIESVIPSLDKEALKVLKSMPKFVNSKILKRESNDYYYFYLTF